MSDHVMELLSAYLDGELHDRQLMKIEAHLDECQTCREEYQSLQALSVTLGEFSLPELPAPDRFAADLALRLPRKPVKPVSNRALEIGWWLAPVGLLVAWIFFSTTILVSNMVTTANELGLLSNASSWLVAGSGAGVNYSAYLGQFGLLDSNSLQWFSDTESFTRNIVTDIFWQVSIAMLYLSWIAIWWARRSRQGPGQLLES